MLKIRFKTKEELMKAKVETLNSSEQIIREFIIRYPDTMLEEALELSEIIP
jgi:hypothetical protein